MINELELINFRNFKNKKLSFNNNFIIIIGENGVGKTSILESIYYSSTTKSFKTSNYLNLINNESDYSNILINYNNQNYKVIINKKNKLFFINNRLINRLDFINKIKVVCFNSNDLNFIKGTQEEKRKLLDLNISLLDDKYLNNLLLYKKILKKRNELLKDNKLDLKLINVITDELIKPAKYLNQVRINFINKLNLEIKNIVNSMKLFDLNFELKCSDLDYKKCLDKDIFYKTTTTGPHRDIYNIKFNGEDIKSYGSQGQIKIAVIVIKLAIYNLVKENNNPILLLDDVFAELDYDKQIKIINYLNNYQTFITTTSLKEIPSELLNNCQIIEIRKDDINGRN